MRIKKLIPTLFLTGVLAAMQTVAYAENDPRELEDADAEVNVTAEATGSDDGTGSSQSATAARVPAEKKDLDEAVSNPEPITPATEIAAVNKEPTEREELLELKNTITNLIDELVNVGVLPEQKADLMKQTAAAKASVQAAREAREAEQKEAEQAIADQKAVRVQYVPDFIKEEIRNEVRAELRKDVVDDVMVQAKNEAWGVPDALPQWVQRLKLSGDVRLRNESTLYAGDINLDSDNDGFRDVAPDFLALNEAQQNLAETRIREPQNPAISQDPNQFFRERERTRNRFRERVRLAMSYEISSDLEIGVRLGSSNINSPVSLQQDLGNTGDRTEVALDRGYIRFTDLDVDGFPWLTIWTGRFENPFYSTDLVFDPDLSFQGVALGMKTNLAGGNSLLARDDRSKQMFVNVGAFPFEEFEVSSQDKWLFGAQLGTSLTFRDQSSFKLALSYYDYVNTQGVRNEAQNAGNTGFTFQKNDFTAPKFLQGGNTMFDIRNDVTTGTFDTTQTALYALASDYNMLNLTASYDWAAFAPIHVVFTADFVKNFGFDRDDILERFVAGGNPAAAQIYQHQLLDSTNAAALLEEQTLGYSFMMQIGWPRINRKGHWEIFGGYKYLESDAVLDAFAESNFGGGGTNNSGFILGGRYGINQFAWLMGRYMTSNSIDGPNIGIDLLQFDFVAAF